MTPTVAMRPAVVGFRGHQYFLRRWKDLSVVGSSCGSSTRGTCGAGGGGGAGDGGGGAGDGGGGAGSGGVAAERRGCGSLFAPDGVEGLRSCPWW